MVENTFETMSEYARCISSRLLKTGGVGGGGAKASKSYRVSNSLAEIGSCCAKFSTHDGL